MIEHSIVIDHFPFVEEVDRNQNTAINMVRGWSLYCVVTDCYGKGVGLVFGTNIARLINIMLRGWGLYSKSGKGLRLEVAVL